MRRLLLIGLALIPVLSFAQGFQVNLQGQKQIGMGHTGTGLAQDGASVFFNPGAMAMLPENYIQAGISPLVFKSTFEGYGSNVQVGNANKIATPFNFYGVWGPKDSRFKFGLGIYTPYGGLTDWGTNWQGKYALESLNLKAIYFQPTVSIKLADFLSIGAGFVYDYGSVDLTRGIPVSASAQAELKGSGNGTGYNLGLFFKTEDNATIGLNYRSKVKTTINNGDAIFTSVPASLQTQFPAGDQFSAAISLPATTTFGIGFHPTEKWTVALDADYVQWSVYQSLDFNYTLPVNGSSTTSSPRNYQDAFAIRGGAQYKSSDQLALRFGGGYASTAVRDGYVTPEVPDANRFYGTLGLGYTVAKKLDIDVSFEYERLLSRTQTNFETNLQGTFSTNVFIPGVSIAYHW
jgi:long-chain fatty acid transport protein